MEENISEICTDRVCDFITSSTAGNRVMEKNGLFSSARRDKFSSAPSVHEKPAELFRKDLISAMKLADSEHLEEKEYLGLQDPWRQDWEKGVQVPVALDAIPDLSVRVVPENETLHGPYGFKLPKKFLHAVKDENYRTSQHELHESHKLAEEICRYDLDDFDVTWLQLVNEERDGMGEEAIEEWVMERVMESLETQCYNNMQNMIKTVEGLGIEYDENVVCDVCRSPEGEDNNEMVFCDSCDLCVHQACYGIVSIPEGSWLCRTCATGVQPKCMLCPKLGGAMKSSKSGSKWAHVSCALWIPEVNFVNPEKMEPITNISNIPSSRWSLVCSICREKTGACIQCAVKSCKTAFHVTCGFQANLDMKTLFNEDSDQVQLKGYCMKHTRRRDGDNTPRKSENKKSETPKKECDMTEEEKTEARSAKLAKLAEEFYTCVTPDEVAGLLNLDKILVDYICAYWILKRKANFNKPLMTPKTEEAELLSKQREDSLLARMKMFIHLRQDLERVRNLCYMVSKREKMSKQLSRLKEEVFYKQVDVLDKECNANRITKREFASIIQAHKIKDSVYDSHDKVIAFSKVVEKIAQDESVKDEQPSIAPKARIKFEPHRQQRSEVNPKKLKEVSKEESSSEVDVINLPKECTLKSLSDKKVIETVANSLLSSSSGEANLKVKDQNKLVANSGQVVKKDLTTPKKKKVPTATLR